MDIYKKFGRYFETADRDKLREEFDAAYDEGEKALTIRCSSSDVFNTFTTELFDGGKVFDYLRGSGKARFVRNDDELTISFLLAS